MARARRFIDTAPGQLLIASTLLLVTALYCTSEPDEARHIAAVGRHADAPTATMRVDGTTGDAQTGDGQIPSYPAAAQFRLVSHDCDTTSTGSNVWGVQCDDGQCRELKWSAARPIPWEALGPGEYVGPARLPHVPEYRLRPNDQLQIIFRESRERSDRPYRLNVGDEVRVESVADAALDRTVTIQPDGTITLKLLNQVPAAGRTVEELRRDIEDDYKRLYREPAMTVTPIKDNTKLKDLLAAIRVNYGTLAQGQLLTVSPDGGIQLIGIGTVFVQGLTIDEAKREIDERYRDLVGDGLDATPVLLQRAPRFVYVLGEARQPGQFALQGPTTVSQAIAMAGGWNVGANLRQIVIFRRTDEWKLMATKIDLAGALYGDRPCPADELFLRDSDVVLLPKHPLLRGDDWISLVFTRGLYSVLPGFSTAYSLKASQL